MSMNPSVQDDTLPCGGTLRLFRVPGIDAICLAISGLCACAFVCPRTCVAPLLHAETPTCWWLAFIVDAGENSTATIVGYPGKKGQTETVNSEHRFRVAMHWDFDARSWVSPLQSSYAGDPPASAACIVTYVSRSRSGACLRWFTCGTVRFVCCSESTQGRPRAQRSHQALPGMKYTFNI